MTPTIQEGGCTNPRPSVRGVLTSSVIRHVTAGLCGLATLGGVALLVAGSREQYAAALLLGGLFGPFAFFILHLNLTRELTEAEKEVWRRDLWVGWTAAAAVWTYLLAGDLKRESKGRLEASGL